MIIDIIKKLNEFVSPSGNEKKLLEYVRSEIEAYSDECFFDVMGNLVAVSLRIPSRQLNAKGDPIISNPKYASFASEASRGICS